MTASDGSWGWSHQKAQLHSLAPQLGWAEWLEARRITLSPYGLCVAGLGFLPVWQSQGGQVFTSYLASSKSAFQEIPVEAARLLMK